MQIDPHYLQELTGIIKIFLSLIAGGCIGWEREQAGKEAGIRTFGFICAGACALAVVATFYEPNPSSRILSNIVLGIGFLAGGTILRYSRSTDEPQIDHPGAHSLGTVAHGAQGLTTAASIWVASSVGMMIGLDLYLLAIALTSFIVLVLQMPKTSIWKYFSKAK